MNSPCPALSLVAIDDRVQAAVSNQHELESFVLVETGPHAGRPGEVESEDFVVTLVEPSEADGHPEAL